MNEDEYVVKKPLPKLIENNKRVDIKSWTEDAGIMKSVLRSSSEKKRMRSWTADYWIFEQTYYRYSAMCQRRGICWWWIDSNKFEWLLIQAVRGPYWLKGCKTGIDDHFQHWDWVADIVPNRKERYLMQTLFWVHSVWMISWKNFIFDATIAKLFVSWRKKCWNLN